MAGSNAGTMYGKGCYLAENCSLALVFVETLASTSGEFSSNFAGWHGYFGVQRIGVIGLLSLLNSGECLDLGESCRGCRRFGGLPFHSGAGWNVFSASVCQNRGPSVWGILFKLVLCLGSLPRKVSTRNPLVYHHFPFQTTYLTVVYIYIYIKGCIYNLYIILCYIMLYYIILNYIVYYIIYYILYPIYYIIYYILHII